MSKNANVTVLKEAFGAPQIIQSIKKCIIFIFMIKK